MKVCEKCGEPERDCCCKRPKLVNQADTEETPSVGRPNEGRVKLTCYVLPLTLERIRFMVDKTVPEWSTVGKVIDTQFGVPKTKPVAGAGRKAPRGQHGRAKRSSSRAKRANE